MFVIYIKTWNDVAARNAANWANKCSLTHSAPFERQIGCKSHFINQ